ncbi:MAG: uroporphyrinogen-III C-methyltransferase [Candidatus Binataceae bacterium]|nr:uroporphyrinogen-III C-methyltransferase [Candidatus Binataceae bacterium]
MMAQGFVYLVGAGPGDPKLLTLRALELIRAAEVVAYDELVPAPILALMPPQAELLAVGRRHGHEKADYRLHPLVLERARAGRMVVRLKAGDPLIFGRGAEEAEELAAAGIPFEIVPGVSAALGAAAYAGIPLTDRRYASRVTLATGHFAEGGVGSSRETLVLYMAVHRLAENLQRLIDSGWPPATPAACVSAATTPRQHVISGTLADLAARVASEGRSDPALVIVGEVVALRDRIQWFERMPLQGHRVLVARARPGQSKIVSRLRAMGALVMESPRVNVMELDGHSALDAVLAQLDSFDAIVFGCSAGVETVASRLNLLHLKLDHPVVIAVGEDAAAAMARVGHSPKLQLDGACRDAISGSAPALANKRLLLIAAAQGRPNLKAEFEALGAKVEDVAAYRYQYDFTQLDESLPELIVLPSSSAARLILTSTVGTALTGVPMLAIGPATAAAAHVYGAANVTQCPEDTIESAIASAVGMLGGNVVLDRTELSRGESNLGTEASNVFRPAWRRGVYEAIAGRRDIRSFRPDPIPAVTLARILSAAHQAGSVGFSQPWNFIVIDDLEVREKIRAHVDAERLRAAESFSPDRQEKYLALKLEGILDAPLNLCVTCDRKRFGPAVLGRNTMHDTDLYSTCAAIQNLWLAARAEGIGVGWVSILKPEALREILGIPSDIAIVGYLCVGFPQEFPKRPMLETSGWLPRVPLTELVFGNRWNEPPPPELSELLGAIGDHVLGGACGVDSNDDRNQGSDRNAPQTRNGPTAKL